MRLMPLALVCTALAACGVRGPPHPPRPPRQPAPVADDVEETPAVDTTTLEQIR